MTWGEKMNITRLVTHTTVFEENFSGVTVCILVQVYIAMGWLISSSKKNAQLNISTWGIQSLQQNKATRWGLLHLETRCRQERMLLLGDANFQSFVLVLPCFALFQRLV